MLKSQVKQTIKDDGGAPAATVVNKDEMYYDEKTGTWKKKGTASVGDTSYGANTPSSVVSVVNKDDVGGGASNTNESTPRVDTSYAANTVPPVGTLKDQVVRPTLPSADTPKVDTSYGANTGTVPPVGTLKDQVVRPGYLDENGQVISTPVAENPTIPQSALDELKNYGGYHQNASSVKDVLDLGFGGFSSVTPDIDTSYGANASEPKELVGGKYFKGPNGEIYYTDKTGKTIQLGGNVSYDEHGDLIYSTNKETPAPTPSDINTDGLQEIPTVGEPGTNAADPYIEAPSEAPAPEVDTSYGGNIGAPGSGNRDENGGLIIESAFANTAPVDSYDEYLRKKSGAYKEIHDDTTGFYNAQEQKSLDAIEEQRAAGEAHAQAQKDISDKALADSTSVANGYAAEQLAHDLGFNAQQFNDLVASLNKQYGISEAELKNQKALLDTLTEEQKAAVYAYAEKTKNDELAYISNRYDTLVEALNQYKETGTALADEQMELLLGMSEELRAKVYEAAELQRQGAYKSADIERERGVVDARSSYEQNKASYGANAEAIAGMGLAASGFSDRRDMAAYAQQRAETQNANARAATVKREADAAERQAKLGADTEFIKNKYTAESEHAKALGELDLSYQKNMLDAELERGDSERRANSAFDSAIYAADEEARQNKYISNSEFSKGKSDLDLSYEQNMLAANQQKAAGAYEAQSRERAARHETEQARIAEQAGIDLTYGKNMFDVNSEARADKLATEQAADAGRFNADLSYRENMLTNDDTIAAYRQQKADEALAKIEAQDAQNKELYLKLFDLAKSGSYSAEDIASIADAMGLSDARSSGGGSVLSSIYDMANTTQQEIKETTDKEDTANNAMLRSMLTGIETPEELKTIAEANGMSVEEVNKVAGDSIPEKVKTYLKSDDIDSAIAAANAAKEGGLIDDAKYKACCFDIGVKKAQSATDSDSLALIESDLTKMKNSGQLTQKDYDNLVSYMYQNYGKVLDKGSYTANVVKYGTTHSVHVTINGSRENIAQLGTRANNSELNILSKIMEEPYDNALVALEGEVYIYWNNGWNKLRKGSVTDTVNDLISTQADVAAPTHKGVWKTFEDAAADRGSVMSEQMWSKDKQGYSSYQEYLAAMWKKQMG